MWSGFFRIDLVPAILRFRIQLRALSECKINLLEIALFIGEWPWHRDTTSPKGGTVLTISMMPVYQIFICFFSGFCSVIRNEVMNLMRPEDQKMKQIDIMYVGVMETIFCVGLFVWLPLGLLCVVALCVEHWFGIYRRRRSQLLPSPVGNVA